MLLRYLVLSLPLSLAIPVDNEVIGDPDIECGSNAIGITFNTKNVFNGHLYVKGHFDDADCKNELIGRRSTGIALHFETCGMTRLRSLNPRGIFATVTVVISFHPRFITKVDRVYHVQCFYMEADKTVNQQLEVAELTTAFITMPLPMPVCRYEILDGGPDGAPIDFAVIGQQVYHKWTCDTESRDTFCMVVHSCFVDDGRGNRVDMLDQEGCAIDKHILNNLEYPNDLVAGQEAHVFKYADRPALFFQCQVSITLKEDGNECVRPECATLTRRRRSSHPTRWQALSIADRVVDVASSIETLDSFEDLEPSSIILPTSLTRNSSQHCISTPAAVITLSAMLTAAFLITVTCLLRGRCSRQTLSESSN